MNTNMFLQPEYYQTVLGAIALVVVLSMVLERALSVPFEWGIWKDWLETNKLRAPISLVVAWVICQHMQFDLLQYLTRADKTWVGAFSIGTLLTAAVIAGGSKGAILLFQGILGFGKEAVEARIARKADDAAAAGSVPAGKRAVPWWKRKP
jgi:hypothetical protein